MRLVEPISPITLYFSEIMSLNVLFARLKLFPLIVRNKYSNKLKLTPNSKITQTKKLSAFFKKNAVIMFSQLRIMRDSIFKRFSYILAELHEIE